MASPLRSQLATPVDQAMSDGLLRQRRNLMLVSCMLILFDGAGAKLEKVSVLGNELTAARPLALAIGAWIVWAYLLVRYLQYLGAEGNLGITDAIDEKMLGYVKSARSLTPLVDEIGQQPYWVLAPVAPLRWKVTLQHYSPESSSVLESVHEITFLSGLWWRLRAIVSVSWRTPKVTDYVLPLMLAALALAVAVGVHWAQP
jgi:hypothetical protein